MGTARQFAEHKLETLKCFPKQCSRCLLHLVGLQALDPLCLGSVQLVCSSASPKPYSLPLVPTTSLSGTSDY